jgi:hypothetical protein
VRQERGKRLLHTSRHIKEIKTEYSELLPSVVSFCPDQMNVMSTLAGNQPRDLSSQIQGHIINSGQLLC